MRAPLPLIASLLALSLAACDRPAPDAPKPKAAAPSAAPAPAPAPAPAGSSTPAPAAFPGWISFAPESQSYAAILPATPECRLAQLPVGAATVCVFAGEAGGFMVTDAPAPPLDSREKKNAFLDEAISSPPQSVIAKAEAIEINGHLGRFVTASTPNGPFTMAAFLREGRFLTYVATPNPQRPESARLIAEATRSFRPAP